MRKSMSTRTTLLLPHPASKHDMYLGLERRPLRTSGATIENVHFHPAA